MIFILSSLKLLYVIYKSPQKHGVKNGVFSLIFRSKIVLKPLYVVVNHYFFPLNHNTSSELLLPP